MNFKRFACAVLAVSMMWTALPVQSNDTLSFSVTASAADVLAAPKNAKAAVKGDKVTLSWSKVSGADGYRIYEYDSTSKKFVRVKTITGTKTTISGLSSGKHYYKIAAVDKADKKYIAGKTTAKITVSIKGSSASKPASKPSASVSAKPSAAASDAVALAKDMGYGWNLGNTMESCGSWINASSPRNFETAWGAPVTTKTMITNLKKAGIDSVRVPVAWSNMMDKDYNIDKAYFDRVDEIVGYILDNDMYCIINIHWDGGWWEDFGSSSADTREKAMKKYKSMWTQISKHYKNYPDKLIFESANEELGDKTKGSSSLNESYERVNMINQTFVDTVRKSGGKNDNRYLLIAGYNTDMGMTSDKRFEMPEDTVEGRLLVSVHYYSPSTYCIAESESNSWGYKDSWGTETDKNAMEKDFKKMTRFTDAGYGVIIGEYGVARKKLAENSFKFKDGSAEYIDYVTELSKKYGYCPMLWDASTWYKRTEGEFCSKEIADIFKS